MRVFALAAAFMAMSGCSLFWGLDGLQGGGACEGGACADAGPPATDGPGDERPQLDASGDLAMQPADSSVMNDAAPDGASPEASANEGGGPGDASDANPTCTPPAPPTLDDCTGIVALPAPPVIDGVLECGVPLWGMPIEGWSGASAIPPTVEASLAIAWRPDGLYFFVRVTGLGPTRYPAPPGDNQWCGDAVELFADDDGQYANPPAYDDPGTIQLIAESPSDAMTSAAVGVEYRNAVEVGPWSGQFTVVRTSDGFDAEAFVVASDLGLPSWSLALPGRVGMDVAVDLGDSANQTASCPRLGQFTIQMPDIDAACDKPACDVYDLCTPQLLP